MVGGLVVGKVLADPQTPLTMVLIVMVRGVLQPLVPPLLSWVKAFMVYVPGVAQE